MKIRFRIPGSVHAKRQSCLRDNKLPKKRFAHHAQNYPHVHFEQVSSNGFSQKHKKFFDIFYSPDFLGEPKAAAKSGSLCAINLLRCPKHKPRTSNQLKNSSILSAAILTISGEISFMHFPFKRHFRFNPQGMHGKFEWIMTLFSPSACHFLYDIGP